jgi:small-conductance mechanosensitive channel
MTETAIDFWRDVLRGWGPGLVALVAGFLVGWLLRLVAGRRLRKLAARTPARVDDVLIEALEGAWLPLAVLFSVVLGARLSPLADNHRLVVERFALAGLLITLTWAGSRFVRIWFAEPPPEGAAHPAPPSLIAQSARMAVLLVGGLLVLDNVGVDIRALLTIAGVGSLAIGLALQPTLSNFFAGLHLSMSKPIRVGDFIELDDGTQGEVIDISWRTTKLRQLANNFVIVPNNRVADMRILNYSLPLPEQVATVKMGVGYGSDLERVERVALQVARAVQSGLPEGDPAHDPVLRFNQFGESAILFDVVLRARSVTDRAVLVHEFVKRIVARFGAERIELARPQRVLQVAAPDEPAAAGPS